MTGPSDGPAAAGPSGRPPGRGGPDRRKEPAWAAGPSVQVSVAPAGLGGALSTVTIQAQQCLEGVWSVSRVNSILPPSCLVSARRWVRPWLRQAGVRAGFPPGGPCSTPHRRCRAVGMGRPGPVLRPPVRPPGHGGSAQRQVGAGGGTVAGGSSLSSGLGAGRTFPQEEGSPPPPELSCQARLPAGRGRGTQTCPDRGREPGAGGSGPLPRGLFSVVADACPPGPRWPPGRPCSRGVASGTSPAPAGPGTWACVPGEGLPGSPAVRGEAIGAGEVPRVPRATALCWRGFSGCPLPGFQEKAAMGVRRGGLRGRLGRGRGGAWAAQLCAGPRGAPL